MRFTTYTPNMMRSTGMQEALRDAAWRKYIDANVTAIETGENDPDAEMFPMMILDTLASI